RHVRFLIFSFERYSTLRDLHSFPTRRSSDLGNHPLGGHPGYLDVTKGGTGLEITAIGRAQAVMLDPGGSSTALQRLEAPTGAVRSEEHTSELQSRENLVCRLLLEKKKQEKKR